MSFRRQSRSKKKVFISLDIIFQYIFGFNIIGLKSIDPTPGTYFFRNAGFFGDELIAGGFIKNFSFFSIFFVAFKLKNKKKNFVTIPGESWCDVSNFQPKKKECEKKRER